jgi:hypothetical protein
MMLLQPAVNWIARLSLSATCGPGRGHCGQIARLPRLFEPFYLAKNKGKADETLISTGAAALQALISDLGSSRRSTPGKR